MRIINLSVKRSLTLLRPRTFASVLSAGFLLIGGTNAFAANFSVIQAGLGTPGVVAKKVLRYPLVRSDLSASTLGGVAVSSATVGGGYLAFEQLSPGKFFFDGALPVLEKELPAVEQTLSAGNIPMTAVTKSVVRASSNIFLIHIEGTATDTALAAGLAGTLALIHNPQIGVTEMEVPESAVNLPAMIPAKDMKLLDKGSFSLINGDTIVFSLPRADASAIHLGPVTAQESLGVGQTIILAGDGSSAIVAELALRSDEVKGVTAALMNGGFTIAAQSDYFIDDSDRLTFIRAQAISKNADLTKTLDKFEQQGEALASALQMIKKHNN